MRAGSADAAFQNMRYTEIVSDLTEISFATVFHHAGPADHLQIGDLRQLSQKVVLHAIGRMPSVLSRRPGFQTAELRFRLLQVAGQNSLFQVVTPNGTARASNIAAMTAIVGFRRTHFFPRVNGPIRRA